MAMAYQGIYGWFDEPVWWTRLENENGRSRKKSALVDAGTG